MKRIALFVLGVVAVSISMLAQAPAGRGAPAPPPPLEPGASQADVDKALLAAPANLKDQATVIKWKPDFTYDTLRKGTNRMVCFDRSGLSAAAGVLGRVHQHRQPGARGAEHEDRGGSGDRAKTQALLDAAEKDGTRVKPEFGSVWYHLMGADKDRLRGRT